MDDARSSSYVQRPAAAPRGTARASRLALILLAGALLGALAAYEVGPRWLRSDAACFEARIAWRGAAPAAADWPRPPASGENVRSEGARQRPTSTGR
jgi:hypothetical protein